MSDFDTQFIHGQHVNQVYYVIMNQNTFIILDIVQEQEHQDIYGVMLKMHVLQDLVQN